MVRLIECEQKFVQYYIMLFQFQYGAIDSKGNISIVNNLSIFQFQYGAIDSVILKTANALQSTFQFQYGAIDRFSEIAAMQENPPKFQFQYGAIDRMYHFLRRLL